METVKIQLPYHEKTWGDATVILEDLSKSQFKTHTECLDKIVKVFSVYYSNDFALKDTPFISLKYFFENKSTTKEESHEYLSKSLPKIAEMALQAKNYEPKDGLCYSFPNVKFTLKLDRNFVAGLVAMGFLCFYNRSPPKELHGHMTSLNFDNFLHPEFYWSKRPSSQVSKLKCILHYFARLCDSPLTGEVTFHRVCLENEKDVLKKEQLGQSEKVLCDFTVDHRATIEDSGSQTLQVDFANEYIGGGVLGGGNVQEEIRFSLCPELLASMLFMATMQPNEAIVMQGFEQFSQYTGYGNSFTYAGDYIDKAQRSADGNLETTIVAIDAIPYDWDVMEQYHWKHIHRDICKAYIGFLQPYIAEGNKKRVVATGNWGCGVFGGDPQLKSLLQWIAASEADCPGLIYYTFNNKDMLKLHEVVEQIQQAHWGVKDVFKCLMDYCENVRKKKETLFSYMKKSVSSVVEKEGDGQEKSESKHEPSEENRSDLKSQEGESGQTEAMDTQDDNSQEEGREGVAKPVEDKHYRKNDATDTMHCNTLGKEEDAQEKSESKHEPSEESRSQEGEIGQTEAMETQDENRQEQGREGVAKAIEDKHNIESEANDKEQCN